MGDGLGEGVGLVTRGVFLGRVTAADSTGGDTFGGGVVGAGGAGEDVTTGGVGLGLGLEDILGLGVAIATLSGLGFAAIALISGSGAGGRGSAKVIPWMAIDNRNKIDRTGTDDFTE